MSKLCQKYGYIGLLVINAMLLYLYLFKIRAIPLGWDTQFHLNRIEELYRSIQSGHLFSSTGTYAFSRIGLAINRFYPYLFLYLFATLQFFLKPIVAYNLGCFLLTLASLLISYFSIKSLTNSKKTAFLFSVLYNNSGYLLLQISMRGDIAEYIALLLFPIIFVGGKKIFDPGSRQWMWLPVGMILVCYTHILSMILFALFLGCIYVLDYKQINLLMVKRLSVSVIITVLFCLPLLITMLMARSKTAVIIPIVPDVLINEAVSPSNLLYNSLNNAIPNSLLDVNLGLVAAIAGMIGILTFKRRNRELKIMEALGLFFTFLATNLFPWFVFQNTPVHIIQFPWRFLGLATFCFSLVFAELCSKRPNCFVYLLALIICTISFTYMHQYIYNSQATQRISSDSYYKQVAADAVYTDYMPISTLKGMNHTKVFRSKLDVHKHIATVNGQQVKLPQENIISKYNTIQYKVTNLKRGKINKVVLPVLNYGKNYSTHDIRTQVSARGETEVIFVAKRSAQVIKVYVK